MMDQQQGGVVGFDPTESSDGGDDLASFLSGLRTKYAKLFGDSSSGSGTGAHQHATFQGSRPDTAAALSDTHSMGVQDTAAELDAEELEFQARLQHARAGLASMRRSAAALATAQAAAATSSPSNHMVPGHNMHHASPPAAITGKEAATSTVAHEVGAAVPDSCHNVSPGAEMQPAYLGSEPGAALVDAAAPADRPAVVHQMVLAEGPGRSDAQHAAHTSLAGALWGSTYASSATSLSSLTAPGGDSSYEYSVTGGDEGDDEGKQVEGDEHLGELGKELEGEGLVETGNKEEQPIPALMLHSDQQGVGADADADQDEYTAWQSSPQPAGLLGVAPAEAGQGRVPGALFDTFAAVGANPLWQAERQSPQPGYASEASGWLLSGLDMQQGCSAHDAEHMAVPLMQQAAHSAEDWVQEVKQHTGMAGMQGPPEDKQLQMQLQYGHGNHLELQVSPNGCRHESEGVQDTTGQARQQQGWGLPQEDLEATHQEGAVLHDSYVTCRGPHVSGTHSGHPAGELMMVGEVRRQTWETESVAAQELSLAGSVLHSARPTLTTRSTSSTPASPGDNSNSLYSSKHHGDHVHEQGLQGVAEEEQQGLGERHGGRNQQQAQYEHSSPQQQGASTIVLMPEDTESPGEGITLSPNLHSSSGLSRLTPDSQPPAWPPYTSSAMSGFSAADFASAKVGQPAEVLGEQLAQEHAPADPLNETGIHSPPSMRTSGYAAGTHPVQLQSFGDIADEEVLAAPEAQEQRLTMGEVVQLGSNAEPTSDHPSNTTALYASLSGQPATSPASGGRLRRRWELPPAASDDSRAKLMGHLVMDTATNPDQLDGSSAADTDTKAGTGLEQFTGAEGALQDGRDVAVHQAEDWEGSPSAHLHGVWGPGGGQQHEGLGPSTTHDTLEQSAEACDPIAALRRGVAASVVVADGTDDAPAAAGASTPFFTPRGGTPSSRWTPSSAVAVQGFARGHTAEHLSNNSASGGHPDASVTDTNNDAIDGTPDDSHPHQHRHSTQAVAARDWGKLNQELLAAGFSEMPLHSTDGTDRPEDRVLYRTLEGVLQQYSRRQKLVSDLLTATEQAARNEEALQEAVSKAQREAAAAQRAAEKSRKELQEVASQQLPRTKAEFQVQMAKMRSELSRLKDQMKDSEAALAGKDAEIRDLKSTVQSLQLSAAQSVDAEVATLRGKVAQLEAGLKSKDKELEKMRAVHSTTREESSEAAAAALERAFAAEDASQRWESESQGLRAKLQTVEQAFKARERDLTLALSEADTRLETQAASLSLLTERVTSAEEGARKAESESAQLRARLSASEQALKAAHKECAKLKETAEAVRVGAYQELYRTEDEVRSLKEELSSRSSRVTHLEFALKAKDREVGRAKEEKEAARAAERERTKVAEEVAIKVETELAQAKQRAAQLESTLRASQREVRALDEALRAARGSEYEGLVKSTKAEEGTRKVESDLAASKARIMQLEASLKSREREVTHLTRTIEALKTDLHEADARCARLDEGLKRVEGDAAAGRSRCLSLEGAVRVKEREVERLTRLLEAAKLADVAATTRVSDAEDAARRLEGELASARVRVAQLESALKAREAANDKLARQLDALRREEYDAALQASKVDEAARRLDGDLATLRARITQQDALLRAKDKEVERAARAVEAAQAAEYEATALRLQAEEAAQRLESELVGIRQRILQVDNAAKGRDKEVERLTKLLDMTRASEFEISVKLAQAEEAVTSLGDELAAATKRATQLEGSLKAKDKEVDRLSKQISGVKASDAQAALQASEAQQSLRAVQEEVGSLRQKLAQAEQATRSKEKEVERLGKMLQSIKGSGYESEAQRLAQQEATHLLDEQLSLIRSRVVQLEGALRGKDKEVERMQKALDAAQAHAADMELKLAESEESGRKAEAELGGLRAKLAQADSSAKMRERQIERLERMLDSAKSDQLEAESRRSAAEEAARLAADELAGARQRTAQVEQALRSKEREAERLSKALEGTKSSEVEASLRISKAEEGQRAAAEEVAAAKQRCVQLEGTLKAKEREVERLNKQLSQAKGVEHSTEAQKAQVEDAARRLDSELSAARARATQLEAALRGRDKDVEALQRLLEQAKGSELMAAAHKSRAEDEAKKWEAEAGAGRVRIMQLEAQLKARAKALERAQAALQESGAETSLHLARTDELMRRVESQMAGMRAHAAKLQAALKAKDNEVTRLTKALAAARSSEHDTHAGLLRKSEVTQELAGELAGLRSRITHLESSLRSKDKEVERALRTVEAAQVAEAQASTRHAALEAAARQLDREATTVRQRLVSLSSQLKLKEQQAGRLERQVEVVRAAEQEAYEKRAQAEEAVRRLEAEAAQLRQRAVQAEASARAREREVATLQRQLHGVQREEFEASAQAAATEEAARQLDSELTAMRSRLRAVEGSLKAKDAEVSKLCKQLDLKQGSEEELAARQQAADEAFRRLDGDLAGMRSRLLTLEGAVKAKERDVERLTKEVEAARASEAASELRLSEAEAGARAARDEAAAAKQRAAQLEASVRSKEAAVDKAIKASEVAKAAQQATDTARAEAEAALRAAEAELGSVRQRAVQAEQVIRAKEREVERLTKLLQAAKGSEYESEAARLAHEESSRALDEQLGLIRARVSQLEGALKGRDKEVERLSKALEAAKASEGATLSSKLQLQEALHELQGELGSIRSRVIQLEGLLKAKDKEVATLQKQLEAARTSEHETEARKLMTEDAARAVDAELAAMRSRLLQSEALLKAKDREVERLQKALDASKASELEAEVQRLEAQEALKRLEGDIAGLRSRAAQGEASAKSKDREVERLARAVEASKATENEALTARSKAEEAAGRAEAESAALRVRTAQLEGQLRLKEKEVVRAGKEVEAARADLQELQGQVSKAEEAVRKAGEEAATARGRASLLDSTLKVKDREIERLGRSLEAARATEYELTAAQLQAEESSRALDEQLGLIRARVSQLEGALKGRDKEVERLNKALEAVRHSEYDITGKQLATEEEARRLDGSVSSLRQQLLVQEGLLRGKSKEVERLTRVLETQGGATEQELGDAKTKVTKLESELSSVRSKLVACETSSRAKEAETARLSKLLEATKASEADFAGRHAAAEEAARAAQAEVAAARQRVVQLEAQLRSKEQEVSKLTKQLEQAQGGEHEASADRSRAQEAAHKAESEAQATTKRVSQLEGALKGKDREVERLQKALDAAQAQLAEANLQLAKEQEATRKAEGDCGALRSKLLHVEAGARVKEREVERLSKQLSSAEATGTQASLASDELSRKAAEELAAAARKLTQLDASLKSRDKEVERLQRALAASQAEAEELKGEISAVVARLGAAELEATGLKQKAAQAEGVVKARDKEVERLTRQVEAAKVEATGVGLSASKAAGRSAEEVRRLEDRLAQSQARVTALESALAAAEREAATAQNAAAWRKDTEAESAVAATERAGRAEAALAKADAECGQLRARVSHLEHTLRSREGVLEKLRAALADKVAREERIVSRDKQAYTRLRSAFATHKAELQGRNAAGAVAAAARELRPVEIVGVYEQQKETMEAELTALRSEVRLLAGQLRDAQNLISLKDRAGAWRNPAADAETQAKVMALEQRAAELGRQLAAARQEGADAVRAAELRVAEAERRAQALAEENNSLLTELQARPTLQDNRALKREVDILEKRLAALKQGSAAAGVAGSPGSNQQQLGGSSGVAAEGGELALGLKGVGRAALATRDRIRRDREVHRLRLGAVEDLPRDVLVDLVQDVCIELDVGDATTLVTAVRKLMRVVSAVPRMEAFIAEVCEAVYVRGEPLLPGPLKGGPRDPTKVVSILQTWISGLQEASSIRGVLASASEILSQRAEPSARAAGPPANPQAFLQSLRQLVAAEAHALAGAASMAAAESALATAQPSDILASTVRHFQSLFECPRLDGVITAMNKVYMTLSEQRNFVRNLASQLGLPQDSATAAVSQALTNTMQQLTQSAATTQQPQQPAQPAPSHQQSAAEAVAALQQAVGQEWLGAITRLTELFNARSATQCVEAAERLVSRLRKLDEALPRYQRVTSQLYELLRVRTLDEVVPAVTALVLA